MFEETRPPPIGSTTEKLTDPKPRSLALKECRVKCAKNKNQLLLGKPKDVPTPQKLSLPAE